MSGADIAAEVAAALAEAGAETGNGEPLEGFIIRNLGDDKTTYPPVNGADVPCRCTLILTQYSARDRDGTSVTARDVRATIAADAEADPRIGDTVFVGESEYHVKNVAAEKPGGVVLYWDVQLRAANG